MDLRPAKSSQKDSTHETRRMKIMKYSPGESAKCRLQNDQQRETAQRDSNS